MSAGVIMATLFLGQPTTHVRDVKLGDEPWSKFVAMEVISPRGEHIDIDQYLELPSKYLFINYCYFKAWSRKLLTSAGRG